MDDTLLPVTEAVELALGEPIPKSTCDRWARSGCRGIVLRTWKIGRRKRTTLRAVIEFVAALETTPSSKTQSDKAGCVRSGLKSEYDELFG